MRNLRHSYASTAIIFPIVAVTVACTHAGAGNVGSSSSSGGSTNTTAGGSTSIPGAGTTSSSGTNSGAGTSSSSGGTSSGTSGSTGNPSGGTGAGGETVIGNSGSGGAATVTKMSCSDMSYSDAYTVGYTQSSSVLSQVQSTVSVMSAAEKASQMRGTDPAQGKNFSDIFRTLDNTTRSVAGFKFRDGPRGVNLAAQLASGKNGYSTAFPVPMARGASFDLDLELRVGQAIGDETLASGNNMVLAPAINILRHPAWGRAQETYGEDPFLLGRFGSAFTIGVQQYVPACVKHFAANNIEDGRETEISHIVDEQTFHEMYVRHFGMVVQEGGVACVMAAYNQLSVGSGAAAHCTQNQELLTSVLRTDYGFKGFVLSDWWALPPGQTIPPQSQEQGNTQLAINAGLDMELPWSLNFSQLETLATGGQITATNLTTSASRILEQKFRFKIDKIGQTGGLTAPTTTLSSAGSIENNQNHIAIALEAAKKSMVLLKNDNKTLPIQRSAVHTIAVVGADVPFTTTSTETLTGTVHFATDVRTGDLGSSRVFTDPAKSAGPFAGIQAAAGSGITVTSGNSVSAAQGADFIVVVAGLTPEDEGEEYTGAGDRPNFSLDGKHGGPGNSPQNNLITQVAALGKPMVVVLEGGSVIDMPWLAQVPAVVMAWYPGMVGGTALGSLLFGDANFSGKLPITWPKSWNDEPTFNSGSSTDMDYYLGYRWFDNKAIAPLYPFGYGMSYTTFEYSNLVVPCSDVTSNGVVNVQVNVKNSGSVAGDEIAYLFVSYPGSSVRHAAKELKGFYRVSLMAGETKQITIPLRVSDLKYYDQNAKAWAPATGSVQISVGSSAANLPLTDSVTLK